MAGKPYVTGQMESLTAIVTGASRGIGLAVARMFAWEGANLVLVGRDRPRLEAAAQDVTEAAGRRPTVVIGDLTDGATAEHAVAQAQATFGRLDVLANVAGWYPTARVEDTEDGDFKATLDGNLYSTFAMCRAAIPALREARGSIVNMSSTAARFPTPGLAAYSASKAGIEAFTRAMAAEVAPDVRVNAVSAGPTRTDAVAALMESDKTGAVAAVTSHLPLGRLAEPEEIAEVFLFLASGRAAVITGQIIHANCGGHMA
jgi:NAD(P)-dependent dehydrogenase (short-subunit alcohol dehydrogenase family)